MACELYKKPILFAIVATAAVLVGSVVTTFIPMFTPQMHPRLENLKPYTALQLAGRDVYQSEGCHYCHTQTVRPLRTEVMRYGEYSKAGEFAYDRPFLWGSKRTGPDLARIGGKYPDAWHYRHFENAQALFPESNMPPYGWLKNNRLDPGSVRSHMDALGFPYNDDEMAALADKTELDALVAYMQVIGTAVVRKTAPLVTAKIEDKNPLAGDPKATGLGKELYDANCAACHGAAGKGDIAPSVVDDVWIGVKGDMSDSALYSIIADGTESGKMIEGRKAEGGMPPFGAQMDKTKIWSLVAYMRSIRQN